ncbi:hypothetical protein HOY34_19940 [Xinfangfangia sp. D13-10-4-6]|uniref:hypothetical protein n=1 Tax=Pseudogemmobacter hezensis TaxID=2737662 RepID=UPI0015523FD6|nr:hypothetical protein [Pseudogemmobacter hezensis]NPD17461.1 hypothetical protein [Pseudogemmobacter hezensis]
MAILFSGISGGMRGLAVMGALALGAAQAQAQDLVTFNGVTAQGGLNRTGFAGGSNS